MNTLFESVAVNSELESFDLLERKKKLEILLSSDLDFKNENHNDLRHSWHAFPAKFPPRLAQLFIKNLTNEEDIVLDPMMGSCTTLLEADLLGRGAYGFDIDPLSIIIGRAKFQTVDYATVIKLSNKILAASLRKKESYSDSDFEAELTKRFDPETLMFIEYWFAKETSYELLSLIQEIEKISDKNYQNFFKMIFSSIIITKSGGVTSALDLAHTRPHRSKDKKLKSVFIEFSKRIKKNTSNFSHQPRNVIIENANATKLPLGNNEIDLIFTSPPYANNAIDYMRAHKFSLVWFGMRVGELRNIRREFIGSENLAGTNLIELPDFSMGIVNRLKKKNEKKALALHKYYSEMSMVIKEAYRVLKNDRAFILVIATSILNGINTQTHKCLEEMAQAIGFEFVGEGIRNLNRDRRMMPSRNIPTNNSIESRMHQEYVLGFWK